MLEVALYKKIKQIWCFQILYKPLAVAAGWRTYPARRKEFTKLLENRIYLPAFGDFERWKQRVFWDEHFSNHGLCCPEGFVLELVEFPVSDCANYCEVPSRRGHSGRGALRNAA